LKISGGQLKGRKIPVGKLVSKRGDSALLRPTSAKVREALFSIVMKDIRSASFLDLFAGTGTIGFEAISRGAEKVFFVENDRFLVKAIDDHIRKMELMGKAFSYTEPARDFLKRASESGQKFDIIFADPPYASEERDRILSYIDRNNILKPSGCLIIEHASRTTLPGDMKTLHLVKRYRYGDTMLSLYRTRDES